MYADEQLYPDLTARVRALALSFPSLRRAPLVPWHAPALEAWALDAPEPAQWAAAFVLGVWSRLTTWRLRFRLHAAMAAWDDDHRAALAAWAADPWWA